MGIVMTSIEIISELKSKITDHQRKIFDLVWGYYIDKGESFPLQNLQLQLGEIRLDAALSNISGSLIYEEVNNGKRSYRLKLLGALLAKDGEHLIGYLISLLELIKSVYASGKVVDEYIYDYIYSQIPPQNPSERHVIFRFMSFHFSNEFPFYTSHRGNDESWSIKITDNIITLFHANDISDYLNNLLLAEYNPNEPYSINRSPQLVEHGSALNLEGLALIQPNSGLKSNLQNENNISKKAWPNVFETPFDSYEVIEPLGDGGAGKVFAVKNKEGERLALKCLHPERITTERRKRFKNEIDFCSRDEHLNIVRVLDSGFVMIKETKCPFYVMPEFPMTLRKMLSQNIPYAKKIALFLNILDGINAAHKLNTYHRDLKPENILYDPNIELIVVADFGIAHFDADIIATHVETKSTSKMANFGYASPEQRIVGSSVDHRADIFALGLILNEMFTGVVPHGVGYKSISSVVPELAYIDPIVEGMLQNDQNTRTSSIEIVINLLGKHILPTPTQLINVGAKNDTTMQIILNNIISQLTPLHLKFLQNLSDSSKRSTTLSDGFASLVPELKDLPSIYKTIWKDLRDRELIDSDAPIPNAQMQTVTIEISELGLQVIRLVSAM